VVERELIALLKEGLYMGVGLSISKTFKSEKGPLTSLSIVGHIFFFAFSAKPSKSWITRLY